MSDLDAFDEITREVRYLTPWHLLFEEAETELRELYPNGFEIENIGRTAWANLPEAEKPAALDCLFYTYWAATQAEQENRARWEQQRIRQLETALAEVQTLAADLGRELAKSVEAETEARLTEQQDGGER